MDNLSLGPSEETTLVTPVFNPIMDQLMAKMKFAPRQGLGKSNQGISTPILLTTNPGKAELGYSQIQSGRGNKLQRHLVSIRSARVIPKEPVIGMTEISCPAFSWDQATMKVDPTDQTSTSTLLDLATSCI